MLTRSNYSSITDRDEFQGSVNTEMNFQCKFMSALNVLPKTLGGYAHFPHGQNASSENAVMEGHQINKEISSKVF